MHHSIRIAAAFVGVAAALSAETLTGRWDGTVLVGSLRVPFTMHMEGAGAGFSVSMATGDTRVRSTGASFEGKAAHAEFPAARMQAVLSAGELKGTFGPNKFQAAAYCTCSVAGEAGPDISGQWPLPEADWKISIRRTGEDTIAIVSRGGKESGPLSGRFNGAFFELSYFDGANAALLEIEPRKDGGLNVSWMEPGAAARKLTALRK